MTLSKFTANTKQIAWVDKNTVTSSYTELHYFSKRFIFHGPFFKWPKPFAQYRINAYFIIYMALIININFNFEYAMQYKSDQMF